MLTDYEQARLLTLSRNKEMLQTLGLSNPIFPKKVKATRRKPYKIIIPPIRSSKRLRSEKVDEFDEMLNKTEAIESTPVPLTVSFPISLLSKVTIWNMGELTNQASFWSSGGCKYKHPYPVHYHCTKTHFGKEWICRIEAGKDEAGMAVPLFSVSDGTNTFIGTTPTSPWTKVCESMASKHGGTRISGPLFFGFSDPITQELIQNMTDYCSFEEWKNQNLLSTRS